MPESRRTEEVKAKLIRSITDDLKKELFTQDPRKIQDLFNRNGQNTGRVLRDLSYKLAKVHKRHLDSQSKYPDVGFYFDLELSERDISLTEIKVQIRGWKLTDYAQGYDREFAKFAQRKGLRFAPKGRGTREVKEGESLWKIAREVYGRGSYWGEIYQQNLDLIGKNPDFILAGIQLKIPELLVPAALITDLNEPRPNNQSPAHLKAKRLSSPTLSIDFFSQERYFGLLSIGPSMYMGKAKISGVMKLKDSNGVKNPQSINFDLYKQKVSSSIKLFGSSLSLHPDAKSGSAITVKSKLFNFGSLTVYVHGTTPGTLAGSVSYKGLRYKIESFDFEVDFQLEVSLTKVNQSENETVDNYHELSSLLREMTVVSGAVIAVFFSILGAMIFAGRLDFEEMEKVPVLWAKAKREMSDFKV